MVSDDALNALALRHALTNLASLTVATDRSPRGLSTQDAFDLGDTPSLSVVQAQDKVNLQDSGYRKT